MARALALLITATGAVHMKQLESMNNSQTGQRCCVYEDPHPHVKAPEKWEIDYWFGKYDATTCLPSPEVTLTECNYATFLEEVDKEIAGKHSALQHQRAKRFSFDRFITKMELSGKLIRLVEKDVKKKLSVCATKGKGLLDWAERFGEFKESRACSTKCSGKGGSKQCRVKELLKKFGSDISEKEREEIRKRLNEFDSNIPGEEVAEMRATTRSLLRELIVDVYVQDYETDYGYTPAKSVVTKHVTKQTVDDHWKSCVVTTDPKTEEFITITNELCEGVDPDCTKFHMNDQVFQNKMMVERKKRVERSQ